MCFIDSHICFYLSLKRFAKTERIPKTYIARKTGCSSTCTCICMQLPNNILLVQLPVVLDDIQTRIPRRNIPFYHAIYHTVTFTSTLKFPSPDIVQPIRTLLPSL